MNKLLLSLLLLSVIALAGCGDNGFTGGHDETQLKQEQCANKQSDMQNKQSTGMIVLESFYTQQLNTCVYVTAGNGVKFIVDMYNPAGFEDTGFNALYSAPTSCENATYQGDCLNRIKEFDAKLVELKGE